MISDPRRVPLSTPALTILEELPRRLESRVWGIRPDSISQALRQSPSPLDHPTNLIIGVSTVAPMRPGGRPYGMIGSRAMRGLREG